MKTIILCYLVSSVGMSSHGDCDTHRYTKLIRTCQAILFQKLANSSKSNPFDDCG